MRTGLELGTLNLRAWIEVTEEADRLGYESVWTPSTSSCRSTPSGSPTTAPTTPRSRPRRRGARPRRRAPSRRGRGVTRLIVRPWARSSEAVDAIRGFAGDVVQPISAGG